MFALLARAGLLVAPVAAATADECNSDLLVLLQSNVTLGGDAQPRSVLRAQQQLLDPSSVPASASDIAVAALALGVLILSAVGTYKAVEVFEKRPPLIAEFIGTFSLVFTVAYCIATGVDTWNAFAIAAVLMVMIYATASSSGANLNPAVTFALWCTGRAGMTATKLLMYWCAQLGAGACAAHAANKLLLPAITSSRSQWSLFPGEGFGLAEALLVELIYSFMLCFVVLNCTAVESKKGNNYFGLSIGLVIAAGGYAAGAISCAAFNPAVALGLDLFGRSRFLFNCVFWSLAEFVGAALAASVFKTVRSSHAEVFTVGQKLVSEFIGTFLLVLTVGLNLTTNSETIALSAASALACMVYALGDVSGAHFNPAVSFAMYLREESSKGLDLFLYVMMQVFAGLCAGWFYAEIHKRGPNKNTTYGLEPGPAFSVLTAGCAELFATAVLAYVVLATTASPFTKGNHFFGLSIGWCLLAGSLSIGAVSGGELNPAVTAGIAIANAISPGSAAVPYLSSFAMLSLWELAGGAAAAGLFQITHAAQVLSKAESRT
eukprot:TRINITY_DN30805_c0_g1_i1.p1 TRINITY_DN30805_c0_g1~~TRINITY_DN30805_c0_g1_i1.p1  ORF type:complete len:548 (-),score=60.57 TRINITY_DN30805_c0_g1_i1:12-1655(-)